MTVPRRVHTLAFLAFLSFGLASLSGVPIEPDERKIDPVLIATDVPAVTAMQRKIAGSPMRTQSPVPLFFRLGSEDQAFPDRVRELGGTARKVAPRLYIGRIPRDAARYLSNLPEVAYLEAARRARPLLDVSAPAVFADDVQAGSAGWPPPFNTGIHGDNVYVGIVDTGLGNAHLDFHTGGSGSPSRVVHTYSSPQLPLLNPPLSPDPLVDEDGHGTHVTGIAAGNGFSSGGTYTGMAPSSSILFGKTSFFTTDIVAAVSDLLSFAGTTPVSINLSLGLATGPHDGTSSFEDSVNSLATGPATDPDRSKRLIVVAAGNERTDGEHFRTTLPPFGIVTEFLTLIDTLGATAEIWAEGEDRYTVTATLGSESITVASGTSGSSGTGRLSVSNRTTTYPNGATFISVFFLPQTSGQTGSIRLTRTRNGGTGTVDGYIDLLEGTFKDAPEDGTITEPANADNVIAVGSFNTKPGPFDTGPVGDNSTFSSLGPTRDGRTKPDVAAPGSFIWSARSFDAPDTNYFGLVPGNDNYAILAGTSMAAPHVTGIAALVWESNPALTGAQMRERLKKTADPPPGAPDNTWGHGKVNALQAVTESVAGITIVPPLGTSANVIPPGISVTLKGDEKSSGPFGNAISYSWKLLNGGSLTSLTGPQTTFSASTFGNYGITLTVEPGKDPYKTATAMVHVNTIPVASITGPASSDNTDPVTFQGSVTDLDAGQPRTFHWNLVSRPTGSSLALLTPVGPDNTAATLTPDRAGTYEVGLRVDDGLDNSALATKTYTAGPVASNGGGGGGGCSILATFQQERTPASLSAPALILLPIMILGIRRSAGKRNGLRKQAHRVIARLTQDVDLVEQNRRLGSMGLRGGQKRLPHAPKSGPVNQLLARHPVKDAYDLVASPVYPGSGEPSGRRRVGELLRRRHTEFSPPPCKTEDAGLGVATETCGVNLPTRCHKDPENNRERCRCGVSCAASILLLTGKILRGGRR